MTCCWCKRKLFGITAGLWFHSFTYSLTQSLTDCNCELFVLFRTKLPWRVWVNSWSSRPRTSSATPCWTSPWVETLTVGKQTQTHTHRHSLCMESLNWEKGCECWWTMTRRWKSSRAGTVYLPNIYINWYQPACKWGHVYQFAVYLFHHDISLTDCSTIE